MADLEASCGEEEEESSERRPECTERGSAITGGVGGESLPPRKRLSAGYRQNGWLSSEGFPQEIAVFPPGTEGFFQRIGREIVSAGDDDDEGDDDDDGDGEVVADGVEQQQQESCTGCNGVECSSSGGGVGSEGLRRIKHGAVVCLHLCESCSLLYNKSMFCPHCLVMYHDASLLLADPALWLLCCRCGRAVHAECEIKQTSSAAAAIDASSYICPDCASTARRHKESEEEAEEEVLNGLSRSQSKVCSGSVGVNCSTETGVSAAPTMRAESCSLSFKKPRMSRERPKLDNTDHADPSKSEWGRQVLDGGGALADIPKSKNFEPVRKTAQRVLVPVSSCDATAAAAQSAAAQAFKVAMAAKENAAAKASAAVKAAAAAKVALEAAARAARAVAHAQAELRRKAAHSDPKLAESFPKMQIVVPPESQKEKISGRSELEVEKEEKPAGHVGALSLDDEELARQLHRVINSSPRISRSLTPLRRKSSVKTETPSSGVSNSSTDAVKAWPQRSQTSPSEPLSQPKPQQTRPRSVTYKDSRQFDSPRHDAKEIEEIGQMRDQQQPDACEQLNPELPLNPSEPQASAEMSTVIETEAGLGVVTSSAREHLLATTTEAENAAEVPFDVVVEADAEAPHPISDIHERRPDCLQDILEAAVLADSAMSLDEGANTNVPEETHRSECDGGSQQPEGHSTFSDLLVEAKGDKPRCDAILVDEVPSAARPPIPAADDAVNGSAALQDVEMADANMALENFGAADIMDADAVDMVLKDSGAVAEVVDADDAAVAVKDSGAAAAVMCGGDADMVLEEYATEVVRADDADTALQDSQAAETIHTDVPSGVTPGGGLEAHSETVLGVQKEVVVEPGENNTGQKEVVADLEEKTTVSSKYSRPGCKVTQDVVCGVSDCLGISEASSELVHVGKDEDTRHMGLEETAADVQDSRPDCKDSKLVLARWSSFRVCD